MKLVKYLKDNFDLSDLFTFAGLGLVGYGLWQFRPYISLVVVGGILLALGVIGAKR